MMTKMSDNGRAAVGLGADARRAAGPVACTLEVAGDGATLLVIRDLLGGQTRYGDCQRAVDGARAMIATVQPNEMAAPTTCESWDVRALINHMIGVCQNFAGGLRGAAPSPGTADENLAGDDPAGAYARAADAVMQ